MVSLAALKGYDMLIEPFAAAGEVLSFDLTRQQVAFNLFRGRLEMYWPKMKCWLLIVASAGLLEPYVYISYLRQAHDAKKLHLGGLSFNFSAKVSDYIRQVWAKNMLYNFATCGLWSILGFSARFAARWPARARPWHFVGGLLGPRSFLLAPSRRYRGRYCE